MKVQELVVTEEVDTLDSIDKKIEFHKAGQAAVNYTGPMNEKHSAAIKKLLAQREKLIAAAGKVTEGYSLKKTKVDKHAGFGGGLKHMADFRASGIQYDIINNETGKVVGIAWRARQDGYGGRAVEIVMNNGARRWVDVWPSEKGDIEVALNRFMNDPRTSKKYTAEGERAKTPAGDYRDLHTGRVYSKATGTDGNDSYLTPEVLVKQYKERLAAIEASPFKRTKEVAELKRKIEKLSKGN
jgi:hypothetical protein